MSQTATKIPRCNRCFHEISWNKTRREELNTTKPVTPDLQFIHECPKDGNGIVIVAAGFEQQAKENYDKWLASKGGVGGNTATSAGSVASSVTASQPQQQQQYQQQEPTPAQQGQAAIAGILNSEKLDTSIKTAFAELIRQHEEFMQEYEGRFQRMETQITTLIEQGVSLAKTVEDYVTYNPAAYSLTAIFHKLLPLVDMNKLKEQTALEKLQKDQGESTTN